MIKLEPNVFELFAQFREAGYSFASFEQSDWKQKNSPSLILRHDIDFDCDIALAFAKKQAEQGIMATYYFLLRSDAYNLLSQKNTQIVKSIKRLGHHISLHFDPVGYEDPVKGMQTEMQLFSNQFDYQPRVVSIHRPAKCFVGESQNSFPYQHTYMDQYTKDLNYFSDSGGRFRYGDPLQSQAFAQKQNLHLLIHPVWWIKDDVPNIKKLDWLRTKKDADMRDNMMQNCIPYREYIEDSTRRGK